MKRITTLLLAFVSAICFSFVIVGCSDQSLPRIDGAYFLTDEAYKKICNGDYGAVLPKDFYYCVIADNRLAYSNGITIVYNLFADGKEYKGVPVCNTYRQISLRLKNELLYLTDGQETLSFEKDNLYILGESKKASPLSDYNKVDINEEKSKISFYWDHKPEYGNFGIAIEIKTAGASEYQMQKIEHWYQNMYLAEFEKNDFGFGKNYVRIYNVGGPTITNNLQIIIWQNSDYIQLCIEKSRDNELFFTKI